MELFLFVTIAFSLGVVILSSSLWFNLTDAKGNFVYTDVIKSKVSGFFSAKKSEKVKDIDTSDKNHEIILTDSKDIALAKMAQGATVTGSTLPSGVKVSSKGSWIIKGNKIVRQDMPDSY